MSQILKQNDSKLHAQEMEKQAWATAHLRGQRIVLRTLPADKMADGSARDPGWCAMADSLPGIQDRTR